MKCVILGAGLGTRLRPLTETRSKLLIPVANKPIIQHIVDVFVNEGIKDFVLVVGHDLEGIKAYFKKNNQDVNIEYVFQETLDGTAGALRCVSDFIKDTFVFV